MALSTDGALIASGSGMWGINAPGEIAVWDAQTGQQRFMLRGQTGCIMNVAFSPDGKRLATAGTGWRGQRDGARIWDVEQGTMQLAITEAGNVFSVAFSPDGQILALGRADGKVSLCDSSTGAVMSTLSGHQGNVFSLSFRRDGARLASGSRDGTVRVWDVSGGTEIAVIPDLVDVRTVGYSPDGNQLAIGTFDGFVKVFDVVADIRLLGSYSRTTSINQLVYSPDGQRLAVVTTGEGVELWDSWSGQQQQVFRGGILSVAFSSDGRRLATAGNERLVKLWDVTAEQQPREFCPHPSATYVSAMAASPDGRYLAVAPGLNTASSVGYDDKSVKLWDLSTHGITRVFQGHQGWVTGVVFSPDGRRLATSSDDKTVKLWDAMTGEELRTLAAHADIVTCLAFSPDGTRLVSAGSDRTIRLWDAENGNELRTFHSGATGIVCLAYDPGGVFVACGGADGVVRLWDVTSGKVLANGQGHRGRVNDLAISSDGQLLATAGEDALIHIWNPSIVEHSDQIHPIRTLRDYTDRVVSMSFSPDGKRLASTGPHSTARIWDVPTGQEIINLVTRTGDDGNPRTLFSPDGRFLLLSRGTWLTVWDAGVDLEASQLPSSFEDSAIAWHTKEAGNCERNGRVFGAAFHFEQLARLERAKADELATHSADYFDCARRRAEHLQRAGAAYDEIGYHDAAESAYFDEIAILQMLWGNFPREHDHGDYFVAQDPAIGDIFPPHQPVVPGRRVQPPSAGCLRKTDGLTSPSNRAADTGLVGAMLP